MDPRTETHYDVTLDDGKNIRASPVAKVAAFAVTAIVLTVGVFVLTTPSTTTHISTAINTDHRFPGDDRDFGKPDCACRSDCGPADGKIVEPYQYHTCSVDNIECHGFTSHDVEYDPDLVSSSKDCMDENGAANGNCIARCEFVKGRYDCFSFPCINEGWCLDGVDDYTCVCATGFKGENCEIDIKECAFEDDDSNRAVCSENAMCYEEFGSYSCACEKGWKGDGYRSSAIVPTPEWVTDRVAEFEDCVDIDDCESVPCEHGATCTNQIGIPIDEPYPYICTCTSGLTGEKNWAGLTCGTDVDECEEGIHDCDVQAVCVNNAGGFGCLCNEHWVSMTPDGLETHGRVGLAHPDARGCYDQRDCPEAKYAWQGDFTSPCKHSGNCVELADGCLNDGGSVSNCYKCDCWEYSVGWSGYDCEKDENECEDSDQGEYATSLNSCDENAMCTNTMGSYACACNQGWTGDGLACVDANDCEFSPCAHGGTCVDCGTLCFTCECVTGWRGTTCGSDWNECTMGIHSCNDEATCKNSPGSYDCQCDAGFAGDGFGNTMRVIERSVDADGTEHSEMVIKGCEDVDDCDPALFSGNEEGPCVHGTCQDKGPNSYKCTCSIGWVDANCDMDENECDPITGNNNCHVFAKCVNKPGKFDCICEDGYEGNGVSACLDINDCDADKCVHGFCTDLGINDFRCSCDIGYTDRLCNNNIDECTSFTHNCVPRKASCIDTEGSYECECNRGFTGDGILGCEDINDCASNPCGDHGSCESDGGSAIDNCENGCINGMDGYTCNCAEGYTDFNCDWDVNECILKTHNCHQDARCVNIPGGFTCRCTKGWQGDGVTCTDIDDCVFEQQMGDQTTTTIKLKDPCGIDPDMQKEHGYCRNRDPRTEGPGSVCMCDAGWIGKDCTQNLDECVEETDACDAEAYCTDNIGSYECQCKYPVPDAGSDGNNKAGYYGTGFECSACTVCAVGMRPVSVCEERDRECADINECQEVNNCDDHATCDNTYGSFTCECDQNGEGDEWWGVGITTDRCTACTNCNFGFHEEEPCMSTVDRVCKANVLSGDYLIESEADDNRMCMVMMEEEWYPSRVNYGNGDKYCGISIPADEEKGPLQLVKQMVPGAVWKLTALYGNVDTGYGDIYTIQSRVNQQWHCLFFGNDGLDMYPSLQTCTGWDINDMANCPWNNPGKSFCGFSTEPDSLRENGQAVWKISPVKLVESKFIIQNHAKQLRSSIEGDSLWECLAFEKQGAATNPSRYNWGNGDDWCGAGDWEGLGSEIALLNNKQAVFILTYLN